MTQQYSNKQSSEKSFGEDIPIYFAFIDKSLSYNCQSCDQRCCKTGGLPLFPAEQKKLVNRHPALELVAPEPTGGITTFTTPISGCWFLSDGSCDLHGENSPKACSLFPYNLFAIVGDHLVVAPNSLCPLTLAHETHSGVSYASISEQLLTYGAAGAPPSTLRQNAQTSSIPLEIALRNAAELSLDSKGDYPTLLALQYLATKRFRQLGENGLNNINLSPLEEVSESFYDIADEFCQWLGISSISTEEWIRNRSILIAWTPTLRIFAFAELPLEQIPTALLGLAIYAIHWQRSLPQDRQEQPLLPQTLSQLVTACADQITYCAQIGNAILTHNDNQNNPNTKNTAESEKNIVWPNLPDDLLERQRAIASISRITHNTLLSHLNT